MPRIDFTAPLTAADATDDRVTDWSSLSQFVGRSFPNTDPLGFFGQSDEELRVAIMLERIGDTRILANDQNDGLAARSSVRSARDLTACELEILQKHVEGQWSDGFGESLELDGINFYIDYQQIDRQQIEDGVVSRGSGTHDLIPAIRARDIEKVRAALSKGENVRVIIGGTTALGWAFFSKDAEIAHLLIDSGVDVHCRQDGHMTALAWSAICLSDTDAASVVSRLLEFGGFENHEIEYAAELASAKPLCLSVLNKYRSGGTR